MPPKGWTKGEFWEVMSRQEYNQLYYYRLKNNNQCVRCRVKVTEGSICKDCRKINNENQNRRRRGENR